jgi:bifunctional DNase/RNase
LQTSKVVKVARPQIDLLLEAARTTATPAQAKNAEEAFFKALLESTVYVHVPVEPMPLNRMRFVQFIRPDNGQTVLPFFSDRAEAETVARNKFHMVSIIGRRLFELTRGVTLMLNPNVDQVALYPAEIDALLDGRPLGYFTQETLQADEEVGICLPSVPTDSLVLALRDLYAREPAVRAAYLVEVHRPPDDTDVFLLLTLVVTKGSNERMVQLTSLELSSLSPRLERPLTMTCVAPDAELPALCHEGIQFYGT